MLNLGLLVLGGMTAGYHVPRVLDGSVLDYWLYTYYKSLSHLADDGFKDSVKNCNFTVERAVPVRSLIFQYPTTKYLPNINMHFDNTISFSAFSKLRIDQKTCEY